MIPTYIEVVWLSTAVLLGLADGANFVLISCSPKEVDEFIEYFELVHYLLDWLLRLSFIMLLFAIIMTWLCFVALSSDSSALGYAISIEVTIIGLALYFVLDLLMHRTIQSRLRSAI